MEAVAQLFSILNAVKALLPLLRILGQPGRAPKSEEANMTELNSLTVLPTIPTTLPRNESFALLVHDIKNTFNVLLGEVELLEDIMQIHSSQYERDLLGHVKNGIISTCALLTDYQGLGAHPYTDGLLHRRPLFLSEILRHVEQCFMLEAKRRDVELTFVLHDEHLMVEGDAMALERVFANLVHNALKFTPGGGHVTVVAVGRNATEVAVTVSDTGPGIAPEEFPLLFRKYQQTPTGKACGGEGLGLFIVKTLVEAHGGHVSVNSGDCWTSFTVVLPSLPS